MEKRWQRLLFWIVVAVLFFGFLYLIRSVLLPFVVSLMVAYFLDPAADKLEEKGFTRSLATLTITVGFFLSLVLLSIIFVPMLSHQFMELIANLPDTVQNAKSRLLYYSRQIDPQQQLNAREAIANSMNGLMGIGGELLRKIFLSGIAIINVFALVFVTPIVAFYCLRDWDLMVAKVDAILPRAHADTIRARMHEIDVTLSGWIRGQTTVCLLLALFYAVGLSLVGLKNGLLIGFVTGIMSFIPYVGMLVGTIIGLAVALQQYGTWQGVGMVAIVFAAGQFIEGNFITPRLVGSKVGLHPVWVMFGMLAGASLFGFVGVLLAVPVTAIIGVLVRFSLDRYRQSQFYDTITIAVPIDAAPSAPPPAISEPFPAPPKPPLG